MLIFDKDITEYTVKIPIYDNSIYEDNKIFSVQLRMISGVRILLAPSAIDVTIRDDDQTPCECTIKYSL